MFILFLFCVWGFGGSPGFAPTHGDCAVAQQGRTEVARRPLVGGHQAAHVQGGLLLLGETAL